MANDELGQFDVLVRVGSHSVVYTLDHHPFDVVGWDGHLYPYAFSIHDFEPITGRQHQPPPVHQTFELDGAVVCSFCPRRLDDGPDVVTAPYNHANLDSDEVLFYVSGNFFSRRGLEPGAITWHPNGIPHGPGPGVAEQSSGQTPTEALAVMGGPGDGGGGGVVGLVVVVGDATVVVVVASTRSSATGTSVVDPATPVVNRPGGAGFHPSGEASSRHAYSCPASRLSAGSEQRPE